MNHGRVNKCVELKCTGCVEGHQHVTGCRHVGDNFCQCSRILLLLSGPKPGFKCPHGVKKNQPDSSHCYLLTQIRQWFEQQHFYVGRPNHDSADALSTIFSTDSGTATPRNACSHTTIMPKFVTDGTLTPTSIAAVLSKFPRGYSLSERHAAARGILHHKCHVLDGQTSATTDGLHPSYLELHGIGEAKGNELGEMKTVLKDSFHDLLDAVSFSFQELRRLVNEWL